jgi:hypothetical protein
MPDSLPAPNNPTIILKPMHSYPANHKGFTGYSDLQRKTYPHLHLKRYTITNSIKHHQLKNYSQDSLQATSVSVGDSVSLLTVLAVYLPPKLTVKQEQLEDFYNNVGRRFIAGGDYNAKHTWGSRLITPRGREILKTIEWNNLKYLSTGEPTY